MNNFSSWEMYSATMDFVLFMFHVAYFLLLQFLSTFCCLQIIWNFGWTKLLLEILETIDLLSAVQLTLVYM